MAWPGMAAPRRVASNSFQLAAGKGRRERRKVAATASKKYAESCASAIPIASNVKNYRIDKGVLKKGRDIDGAKL